MTLAPLSNKIKAWCYPHHAFMLFIQNSRPYNTHNTLNTFNDERSCIAIGMHSIHHAPTYCEDTMRKPKKPKMELVIYNNDLNQVALHNAKPRELNIFYAVCTIMRDRGTDRLVIPYKEIERIGGITFADTKERHELMKKAGLGILTTVGTILEEGRTTLFTLFNEVVIDDNKECFELNVHEKYAYVLNNLVANFTKFQLLEINDLKSVYSKEVYRHLMQYRDTGSWTVSIEEFRRLMKVPKSYATKDITKEILNRHVMKELPGIFHGLRIERIKKGRTVTHLQFRFTPMKTVSAEDKADAIDILTVAYHECPKCHRPLYWINGDNGRFIGHANNDQEETHCRRTFQSIEEVEALHNAVLIENPSADLQGNIFDAIATNAKINIIEKPAATDFFMYPLSELTQKYPEWAGSSEGQKKLAKLAKMQKLK